MTCLHRQGVFSEFAVKGMLVALKHGYTVYCTKQCHIPHRSDDRNLFSQPFNYTVYTLLANMGVLVLKCWIKKGSPSESGDLATAFFYL